MFNIVGSITLSSSLRRMFVNILSNTANSGGDSLDISFILSMIYSANGRLGTSCKIDAIVPLVVKLYSDSSCEFNFIRPFVSNILM